VAIFVLIGVTIALSVISYLLMPKPKMPKPDAVKDLDDPTAEAGRPVPVPFGTITIKGLNLLWFGDKGKRTYKVDA
jgi:hypothetical protein